MKPTATWRGRRGTVLLGPTEDRVARYLADRTRWGRVAIRSLELAGALQLERSEAYRIVARLRVLGLFGVQDDRGGTTGGRLVWRTATVHDGPSLDPNRHREAWRRIVGWGRRRAELVAARLATLRTTTGFRERATRLGAGGTLTPVGDPAPAGDFESAMRRHGLGAMIDAWAR